MEPNAQPGSQPGDEPKKEAAATGDSHSGPEHQTQNGSDPNVPQEPPASDAASQQADPLGNFWEELQSRSADLRYQPKDDEPENPDDEFFRARQAAGEQASEDARYQPQDDTPQGDQPGGAGDDFLATGDRVARDLSYSPADTAPKVRAPLIGLLRDPDGLNARAVAERFYQRHRDLFTYGGASGGRGATFVYDSRSGMWTADRNRVRNTVTALCLHLADDAYEELAALLPTRQEAVAAGRDTADMDRRIDRLNARIKFCAQGPTMKAARDFGFALVETVIAEETRDMDPDPEMLACKNGLTNLRTKKVRHIRPEDRITRNTGTIYKHDIDYSPWHTVVTQIMGGRADWANAMQLQCGLFLTGYTGQDCGSIFPVWHGDGGNGKNVIADSMLACMGTYARVVNPNVLDEKAKDNSVTYAKAELPGVRFAPASEPQAGMTLHEQFIKDWTGNAKTTARLPYIPEFDFRPQAKIVLLTNPRPRVKGTDDGIWRRVKLIPFEQSFGTQAEVDAAAKMGKTKYLKDTGLLKRFTSKEGREMVLAWAVDGAHRYIQSGGGELKLPREWENATALYRREENQLAQFLTAVSAYVPQHDIDAFEAREKERRDKLEESLYVDKDVLYQLYTEWCEHKGYRQVMSEGVFKRQVLKTDRFCERDKGDEMDTEPMACVEEHSYKRAVQQGGKTRYERRHVYRYFRFNTSPLGARGLVLLEQFAKGIQRPHLNGGHRGAMPGQ